MSDEQKKAISVDMFDAWLRDDGPAALVLREYLLPVEGKDAVIFPPTYTLKGTEQERRFKDGERVPGCYENSKGEGYGYNVDSLPDGTNVCQIDSVGSQANRMEPIFKTGSYAALVPQITIKAGEKVVNLLEAGHRAADAIVRFSELEGELRKAFEAYKEGNAEPLAKLAPTSLVFGAWDSRHTQVKLPRIVRSVIRAYNVRPVHRSAQYIPPVDYAAQGVVDAPADKKGQDALSELGLSHAPAAWTHGGVLVQGEIRREAILNLVTLRALKTSDDASTYKLQRYILGLALVAFTAPQPSALREGCELVGDPHRPPTIERVYRDGRHEPEPLTHKQALQFAQAAAAEFGVGASRTVNFRADEAKAELAKPDKERKADRTGRGKKAAEAQQPQEPKEES